MEDCEHRRNHLMMCIGPNDWCPYCEVERLMKLNRELEKEVEKLRGMVKINEA